MTSPDALVRLAARMGVRHAFGMAADSVNGTCDSITSACGISFHQVFNEKTAGCAALACYLQTGAPAIAVGTSGPGAAHLLQSIVYAHDHRVPAVFVIGMPTPEDPPGSFQDIETERFAYNLGMHMVDARADASRLDLVNREQLPCIVGVDRDTFTGPPPTPWPVRPWQDSCSLSPRSHPSPSLLPAHQEVGAVGSPLVSESLLCHEGRESVLQARNGHGGAQLPAGWGVGYLLAASCTATEVKDSFIYLADALDSLADFICAACRVTGRIRLLYDTDAGRTLCERVIGPALCGTSRLLSCRATDSIHHTPLSLGPARLVSGPVDQSGFSVRPRQVTVSVKRDGKSRAVHSATAEAAVLAAGGWARLGYRGTVSSRSIFSLLSAANGIYDITFDGGGIDIDVDGVGSDVVRRHLPALRSRSRRDSTGTDSTNLRALSTSLSSSRRPVIVAGSGSIPDAEKVTRAARQAGIPILCTMGSLWRYASHRHCLGVIGSSGSVECERIRSRSDLVIYLGLTNRGLAHDTLRLDRPYFDVCEDPSVLAGRSDPRRQVCGSIGDVLDRMCYSHSSRDRDRYWFRLLHDAAAQFSRPRARLTERLSTARPSSRQTVREVVSQYAPADTIIFVDVGLNTLWAIRTLPRSYKVLYTRGFATMGAATLSALGVAGHFSTKRLLVITGDGGFALSLGEFLHHAAGTAVDAGGGRPSVKSDLTVLVLNNGGLGAVRYEQELRGLVPSAWAAPFDAPALAALLPAVDYVPVTSRADLERMDRVQATRRQVRVINAHVDPLEAPVPARSINVRARASLIRSWARQGGQGLLHAARTLPYIIDTWRF